ncbi:MAG: hypothetical protein LC123_07920 [Burkholderiales bacterium]|nr:hypothetical protein [Burkholderiales bacterium]
MLQEKLSKTRAGVGVSFVTVGVLVLGGWLGYESIPEDIRLWVASAATAGATLLAKAVYNKITKAKDEPKADAPTP